MAQQPIRAVGVAFYRREDYPRILEIMEDGRKLPASFDKWEKAAEAAVARLAAGGTVVERVYIDSDTFPDWCAARGIAVDAKARTRFANEAVFRKYGKTQ